MQSDEKEQLVQLILQRVESGSPQGNKSSKNGTPRDKLIEPFLISTRSRFSFSEMSSNKLKIPMENEELNDQEETKSPTTLNESPTKPSSHKKATLEDFTQVGQIGKGTYAEVVLVKKKSSRELFAMKILDKAFLRRVVRTT